MRSFVENGDVVILRSYCERAGFARIGFGDCIAEVVVDPLPAQMWHCLAMGFASPKVLGLLFQSHRTRRRADAICPNRR